MVVLIDIRGSWSGIVVIRVDIGNGYNDIGLRVMVYIYLYIYICCIVIYCIYIDKMEGILEYIWKES